MVHILIKIETEFRVFSSTFFLNPNTPLREVSRLDNTDGVICIPLSHLPDLPEGVSIDIDIILQDGIIIAIIIAPCKCFICVGLCA